MFERFAGGKRVKVSKSGYDVFLVAGQSNAQGAGVGLDSEDADAPDSRVHQFAGSGRNKGRILAGADPLFHQQRATGVGFGVKFGKLHVAATARPVLLVPVARGSSGFHPSDGFTWDRHDTTGAFDLYDFAVSQLAAALATHPANTFRGILWHQGENDTWHMGQGEYAAKLDDLIAGLRERFGDVPFILGQMNPDRMAEGNPGYPLIDAAHRDTPNRVPAASFVEGPHGMFNSDAEKIHYNAAGQHELASRYYQAFITLTLAQSR